MQQITPLGLGDEAYADLPLLERLRRLVTSGTYPPGDPMPELVLAQEFGVSRTPIREALKQLENEGLVEIRPRVGTFVRTPTRREIVELFQLKESLEGLAANLLARRGPTSELAALTRNLDESDAAVRANDTAEYARLVHEFHWTIVLGADNAKLAEHYERLMNQLAYHRIVLRTIERPGRLLASDHEHHAIVRSIVEKDAIGAEFAMRTHVEASSRAALAPEDHGNPAESESAHA
ncbi:MULTISPECIES: GntR family transcriptional regulator [unclassified Pseudoclavibacter]|jgi:DNA-binding GntR family transcriptional regulator|uniref:GntR family transcriptional regulator n=1 Tax=unclassified Pseudoclavibacter TaxID=2615177 RepID=UPI000CE7F156|nr:MULTISPECIES: GntR family transcriptional regulator [unclassified Pseudoclavibacter]MBS3178320.1 GntR family transcriptional regulator [Pseudoclavibacter sp. Marseille-Q4354]NYF14016.1 DNA-binding GntR family transcriptional regulator [Pseudoclavibacter sp. JAI123]PPG29047.1 GntR family transcriptional regulator [Pseudoclavibacter sp. RFBB5]